MPLLEAATTDLHFAWVLAAAAAAAVGLVVAKTELFVTLIHEAGHALTSIAVGGGFSGIRVHHDASGNTEAYAYGPFRFALIAAAGYLTPGAAGVAAAWAYASGRATTGLAVLTAITVLVALAARSVHTFAVAAVFGAVAAASFVWGNPTLQAVIIIAAAWTLLLGGMWDSVHALLAQASDHANIQKYTGIPLVLSGVVTIAANLWFVWVGGRILLGI